MCKYKSGDKFIMEIERECPDNNYCYKIRGAKCILDEGILDQIQKLEEDKVKKEAYESGSNDAWNALQKIFFNYDHGGITCEDLKEIFGDISPSSILMNFKSKEVIERLKRYEKEKIHVGDVVVNKHDKGDFMLVTSICDNKFDAIDLSYEEDDEFPACPNMFINDYKKTGQHFDLEEMFGLDTGE